jgi:D-sedoheptulose 7-phosphate isomerase
VSGKDHSAVYIAAATTIAATLNAIELDTIATSLAAVRARGGRLFVLGVGGGAGHASHAVNDFRKLCALESYAPTDNVSELTARTNDDGWESTFSAWLETSRLNARDALLIFSVGGGSRERGVSVNLIAAMEAACAAGAAIFGVAGTPGGTLAELADVAILIEPPPALRTPLVESFQAVVWHALVSHPALAVKQGHWESLAARAEP